jgi:hypothetical protein
MNDAVPASCGGIDERSPGDPCGSGNVSDGGFISAHSSTGGTGSIVFA